MPKFKYPLLTQGSGVRYSASASAFCWKLWKVSKEGLGNFFDIVGHRPPVTVIFGKVLRTGKHLKKLHGATYMLRSWQHLSVPWRDSCHWLPMHCINMCAMSSGNLRNWWIIVSRMSDNGMVSNCRLICLLRLIYVFKSGTSQFSNTSRSDNYQRQTVGRRKWRLVHLWLGRQPAPSLRRCGWL